jgi:hypothetical protein
MFEHHREIVLEMIKNLRGRKKNQVGWLATLVPIALCQKRPNAP